MGFLSDWSSSIKEETNITILAKKLKNNILIKTIDCNKKPIKGVSISFKNEKLGMTNELGILAIDSEKLPKNGVLQARVGLYSSEYKFTF